MAKPIHRLSDALLANSHKILERNKAIADAQDDKHNREAHNLDLVYEALRYLETEVEKLKSQVKQLSTPCSTKRKL